MGIWVVVVVLLEGEAACAQRIGGRNSAGVQYQVESSVSATRECAFEG